MQWCHEGVQDLLNSDVKTWKKIQKCYVVDVENNPTVFSFYSEGGIGISNLLCKTTELPDLQIATTPKNSQAIQIDASEKIEEISCTLITRKLWTCLLRICFCHSRI